MANPDAPFGFRPMRYRSGAPYNGAVNPYYIPVGDATALFIGDPVAFAADSNANFEGDGRHQPGSLPVCVRATAGSGARTVGVVCGVEWLHRDSLTYRPASTEAIIYVADDPELVFHVQDDGGATPASTNAGLNADLIFTHAGDVAYGRSRAEIAGTTFLGTRTLQTHIIGAARLPNNSPAEDFCIWEVTLNTHQFKGDVTGTTTGL
jgi:hypothetical protein